ncbi:hypothetical protein EYF80_001852 [Liparis tanakae]|uniref:Uncharacterized protein n=1 Tax=Liparis tanakae TaxID=230148 RepID=A0A4Z2JE00_9TELE|nr:hypothetical protein EYF80_001852 [Liparis tanakae]
MGILCSHICAVPSVLLCVALMPREGPGQMVSAGMYSQITNASPCQQGLKIVWPRHPVVWKLAHPGPAPEAHRTAPWYLSFRRMLMLKARTQTTELQLLCNCSDASRDQQGAGLTEFLAGLLIDDLRVDGDGVDLVGLSSGAQTMPVQDYPPRDKGGRQVTAVGDGEPVTCCFVSVFTRTYRHNLRSEPSQHQRSGQQSTVSLGLRAPKSGVRGPYCPPEGVPWTRGEGQGGPV